MLLAIDTASRFISLAVYENEFIWGEHTQYTHNQHTVQLTSAIERMFKELDKSINDLSAIAIAQGPGSYTGLRVSFGVAKGLCTVLQIPLIPIPTLDIVAYSTPHTLVTPDTLLVVLKAGRKRLIVGEYRWRQDSKQWLAAHQPINITWPGLFKKAMTTCIINGELNEQERRWLDEKNIAHFPASSSLRRAGFLAEMAWKCYAQQAFTTDLGTVNPLYLKEP